MIRNDSKMRQASCELDEQNNLVLVKDHMDSWALSIGHDYAEEHQMVFDVDLKSNKWLAVGFSETFEDSDVILTWVTED